MLMNSMLYITYNNTDHTDGAGSQIQRILTLYLCAKHFNIRYVHSPLRTLAYQGLKCLEENTSDDSQIQSYNNLIDLPSDPPSNIDNVYTVKILSTDVIQQFHTCTTNVLLVCTYCSVIDDGNASVLHQTIPLPWIETSLRTPITIAVHVRRGELFVVDSDRMLPNSYYVSIMNGLSLILNYHAIPHEFHIHTECVTKETVITPGHHGILNRIHKDIVLSPYDSQLEDFRVLPNVVYRVNENPVDTFQELTNADILIASRSSFSYVAAILKKKGCVLFHPFWHTLCSNWIETRSIQDVFSNRNKIIGSVYRRYE